MATYCNYHHNYQGHRIENKGGRLCDRGSPDVRGGNVKYYGLHDVWVPFVHRTSNSAHKLTKELKPSPHDTSSGMILTSAALRTLSLPPPRLRCPSTCQEKTGMTCQHGLRLKNSTKRPSCGRAPSRGSSGDVCLLSLRIKRRWSAFPFTQSSPQ